MSRSSHPDDALNQYADVRRISMATAARILDVTPRTLLDWIKSGLLPQPVRPKGANKRGYFIYKDFVAYLNRMVTN